jgi:FMN-dependent NADH-azoreductase
MICNTMMRVECLRATPIGAYLPSIKFKEEGMTKVLIIDSAATGEASVSRKLTAQFANQLREGNPGVQIVHRDIGRAVIPHLNEETVDAIRGAPAETEAAKAALALSDTLVRELNEAEVIVIGAPMYNFGMPSTLKAWFDHVLRARVTFRYNEEGKPEGLVKGKKAIVVESRAGFYSEGPAATMDFQEPHIRFLLGFIGITDVTFIRAEKLAFAAEEAIADAAAQLSTLAETEWALAA